MATPTKEDILALSREVAQEVLTHIKAEVEAMKAAEAGEEEGETNDQ